MPLTVYTPFPAGGTSVSPSDLSEVFLKSYTVASGVSSITISDALFKLSTYKTIHVRFNNLTTSASSTYLGGGALKNDLPATSTYYSTYEAISTTTATGWGTSTGSSLTTAASIASSIQLSRTGQNFSNGISQIDVYINPMGLTIEFHNQDQANAWRNRATQSYASRQTFSSSDYTGMILALGTGTFTGGTVSVFGVQ